jgi:hypothetical protein
MGGFGSRTARLAIAVSRAHIAPMKVSRGIYQWARHRWALAIVVGLFGMSSGSAPCMAQALSFREATGSNAAATKYGASGRGVAVVVMDRGIDWNHPDFINPDGTTRI